MKPIFIVPFVLILLGQSGFAGEVDPQPKQLHAPAWIQKVRVEEATPTHRAYTWNLISATTTPRSGPPRPGLSDYAKAGHPFLKRISASPDHSDKSSPLGPLADDDFRTDKAGEKVPAYWEAIAPATYSVEFSTPVEIHQIDLTAPLRKIGFSDFEVFVEPLEDPTLAPVLIEEATTSRGETLEAGYHWELRIQPTKTRKILLRFRKGTIAFPDRIFLKDLDIWGK